MSKVSTIDEANAAGVVARWPHEIAVDHPGGAAVAYVCTQPVQLGATDGTIHNLGAGDVVSADEANASRTALRRLERHGILVALPVDRGLVALASVLMRRLDQAEQLVADLHGAKRRA